MEGTIPTDEDPWRDQDILSKPCSVRSFDEASLDAIKYLESVKVDTKMVTFSSNVTMSPLVEPGKPIGEFQFRLPHAPENIRDIIDDMVKETPSSEDRENKRQEDLRTSKPQEHRDDVIGEEREIESLIWERITKI